MSVFVCVPTSETVPHHVRVHQRRKAVLLPSAAVLRGRAGLGGGHDGRFRGDLQRGPGGVQAVPQEICGEFSAHCDIITAAAATAGFSRAAV